MLVTPNVDHAAFRTDLLALLGKYSGKLSSEEVLALASHTVGQLIAMQDQRTMTLELALKIVGANIEQGNQEAITNLMDTKGSG